MTWSTLALGWGMTALLGGTFLITPALARPTLPLGVSVPADRIADPAVRRALHAYRLAVLAVTGVALAATGALAAAAPEAAVVVPVLLVTAGGVGAFVRARRPIMAAKAAGDWFAGKAVRMSAPVTAARDEAEIPVRWYLASVVLLAGTTVVGALRYGDLPDRVPVHWDLSGTPDAFADTSPWTALGTVWVGWGTLALMVVLAHASTRAPVRVHPGDPPEHALRRARAQQGAAQWVLATITFATTALVSALALDALLHPEGLRWSAAVLVLFVVALLGCTAEAVRRYRRELGGADRSPAPVRAEAPDDDRFWPGGLVYVNRDDPSVWVPKRVGIGWTVNLGSPGGIAVTVGLVVVLALGLAVPLLVA
ncbi:DUF1648 domain-containing protein [Blastococcus sp. SYSU DS0617]